MIKVSNIETYGWEVAIRGMRNPMNSWEKSDSEFCPNDCETCCALVDKKCRYTGSIIVGDRDLSLMLSLAKAGGSHAKYRRMIGVTMDILAPLYWWKEFDTYKIGTVANSCSTMHKIAEKEFTIDDFSHEHLLGKGCITDHAYQNSYDILCLTIDSLNFWRNKFLIESVEAQKLYWWQMIQLLPSSYNQLRTVSLNYEVLAHIYADRKGHKLDEWRELCHIIEKLPYSRFITLKGENEDES